MTADVREREEGLRLRARYLPLKLSPIPATAERKTQSPSTIRK